MSTLKTAYDSSFMDGVEAAIPKIASMLSTEYGINPDAGAKLAEEWLISAFSGGETKVAYAPPGAGYGAMYGMQRNLPSRRMQVPEPNDYAGAPSPTSVASTAAGVGGAGAVGMAVRRNMQAHGASNKIYQNFMDNAAAAAKAEGKTLTDKALRAQAAEAMPKFLGEQNSRYINSLRRANLEHGAGSFLSNSPKAIMESAERRFLQGAEGDIAANLKNYLKHNAFKKSAMRWGLGGLGLWGLSQFL